MKKLALIIIFLLANLVHASINVNLIRGIDLFTSPDYSFGTNDEFTLRFGIQRNGSFSSKTDFELEFGSHRFSDGIFVSTVSLLDSPVFSDFVDVLTTESDFGVVWKFDFIGSNFLYINSGTQSVEEPIFDFDDFSGQSINAITIELSNLDVNFHPLDEDMSGPEYVLGFDIKNEFSTIPEMSVVLYVSTNSWITFYKSLCGEEAIAIPTIE